MKNLLEKLQESLVTESVWVAIEDHAHADMYHSKDRTSYRVVSLETWEKLKNGESSRSYGEHDYHEIGRSSNREEAESYLPSKEHKPRKSKINKGDAKYIVWVIPMGSIALTTGKCSKFGYSIFDEEHKDSYLYMLGSWEKDGKTIAKVNYELWGAKDSLKLDDTVCLVDNDTQRKTAPYGELRVVAIIKSTKSDFDSFLRKNRHFTEIRRTYNYSRDRYETVKNKMRYYKNYCYSIKGIEK